MSPTTLALISWDCADSAAGAIRTRQGNVVPVLAVGPPLAAARARVAVIGGSPNGLVTIAEEDVPVKSGAYTTIWSELKLPDDCPRIDGVASLVVDAYGEDGNIVACLRAALRL